MGARGIVSHLYNCLEREFPRPREIDMAWLKDGICNGSETAKRRLQSLDPDSYTQTISLLRTRYCGIGIETPSQYWDQETLSDDELFRETRIRHRIGMDANQEQIELRVNLLYDLRKQNQM